MWSVPAQDTKKKPPDGEEKSKTKMAGEQIKDIRESGKRKEKKAGQDDHDVRSSGGAYKDNK
jgi:hypothetical protein